MSMSVVFKPSAMPGQCKLCGGADKEWYLDTGSSEEFFGAIYYCNECVNYIASITGYIAADKISEITNSYELLISENIELRSKNSILKDTIDDLVASGFGNSSYTTEFLDVSKVNELAESVLSETIKPVGIGEGETVKSSHDEGLGELHSTDKQPDSQLSEPFKLNF